MQHDIFVSIKAIPHSLAFNQEIGISTLSDSITSHRHFISDTYQRSLQASRCWLATKHASVLVHINHNTRFASNRMENPSQSKAPQLKALRLGIRSLDHPAISNLNLVVNFSRNDVCQIHLLAPNPRPTLSRHQTRPVSLLAVLSTVVPSKHHPRIQSTSDQNHPQTNLPELRLRSIRIRKTKHSCSILP